MKKPYTPYPKGGIIIITLVFIGIFLVIGGGLLGVLSLQLRLAKLKNAEAQALHVAEAGINYYRWHLAHDPTDYEDGNGPTLCNPCGPYIHDYENIGRFTLTITPPPIGSTVVKIKSTGTVNDHPNVARHIVAQYGIPSLAKYSFLTNVSIWFGPNESIVGPMHGNDGIRQDGTNNNTVTSAKSTYACTASQNCSSSKCNSPCQWKGYCECPGVWGAGYDSNLWNYPIPSVDYNSVTTDLNQIKSEAKNGGYCIGDGTLNCDLGGSSVYGFHIIFLSDGSLDLYRVETLKPPIQQLNNDWTKWIKKAEEINTHTLIGNYDMPSNGLIFVGGDLWVEGQVNGRVSVAAAKLPGNANTYKNIYINNNLTYLARDGNNALGLIAQNNVWVPKHAPNTLTIDAILFSQNGHTARNLYWPYKVQDRIEVYGGVVTNKTWTWTWVYSNLKTADGYDETISIYDPDLTFRPPPSFPTTGQYEFISWEEVLPGEIY